MPSGIVAELKRGWQSLTSLGLAQVAVLAAGLGSASLMAHYFPKETYGQYQLILGWIAIVGPFCLNGLQETLKISAAQKYHGNVGLVFRYKGLATLLGTAAMSLLALWYWQRDPVLAGGMLAGALLFPLTRLEGVWSAWFIASGQLRRLSFLRVLRAALTVAGVAALVVAGLRGLVPLVVLAIGLPGVVGLWNVIRIYRQRANNTRDAASFRYGLHASAATGLAGLVMSDRVIIDSAMTRADVAFWAIALVFPAQIKALSNIFGTYLSPRVYRTESFTAGWRVLRRALPPLAVVFLAAGLAGYFALPYLVPLLFSEKYVDAVPYGRLLWLVMCLIVPGNYVKLLMRAHQKKTIVYAEQIAYPLALLALNLWLVRYGLTGMLIARIAMGLLFSMFVISLLLYYLWRERVADRQQGGP